MKNSAHELKAEFAYLILCERKTNSFETTVIIFKVFKKCKFLIEKEFNRIFSVASYQSILFSSV